MPAKSIFGGAPIDHSNKPQNAKPPYRRTGGRGTVRMPLSLLVAIIVVAAVLILVGIYVYYNDMNFPVVLSIA